MHLHGGGPSTNNRPSFCTEYMRLNRIVDVLGGCRFTSQHFVDTIDPPLPGNEERTNITFYFSSPHQAPGERCGPKLHGRSWNLYEGVPTKIHIYQGITHTNPQRRSAPRRQGVHHPGPSFPTCFRLSFPSLFLRRVGTSLRAPRSAAFFKPTPGTAWRLAVSTPHPAIDRGLGAI